MSYVIPRYIILISMLSKCGDVVIEPHDIQNFDKEKYLNLTN